MWNRTIRAALCAALIGGLGGVAAPASAALGGTPTPPPSGATSLAVTPIVRAASSAVGGANTASPYSVTETTLASGTTVREYVSAAGTVFGIAWNGPRMPDLGTLLGTYFTQFDNARVALRTANPGRGPLDLELPGLVVRSGGHMGAFSGQAYLPQSLPAGVSAADVR